MTILVGEVGVGKEGDQASSGTHPGLPLSQPLPNQPMDQPQQKDHESSSLIKEKNQNKRNLQRRKPLMGISNIEDSSWGGRGW